MVNEIPVEEPTEVALFWCRPCRNLLALAEAAEVDHAIHVNGRLYQSGWCRPCWTLFHAVDSDDVIALHVAMQGMTSFAQITEEQV